MSVAIERNSISLDRNTIIKWIIAIGAPLLLLLVPTNEVFTGQIRTFLILSIMMITIVAMNLLDVMLPAIGMMVLFVLLDVAKFNVAFGSFAGLTAWTIVGAYALTIALSDCGILQRIAAFIIEKLGGSYNRTLYAIYVVGMVLGALTFAGHYFVMIGLVFGFCQAMKLKPLSKEGAIMMGVGGMAALNVKVFEYQTSNMTLINNGMQGVFPDFSITAGQLFLYNCPEIIVAFLFIFLVTKLFKTKDVKFEGGKEYFSKLRADMGPMSNKEKKAVVFMVILMTYMILQPIHKITMNYIWITLPWIMFLPGVKVASQESLTKVKGFFGTWVFACACISIGSVATALGIGSLVAQAALPILEPLGKVAITYGTLFLGGIANLFLTPAAMCNILPDILGNVYLSLGMDPMSAMLTVIYSLDIIFLPHEVTAYLVLYGFGMMSMKQFIAFFGGKSLFTIVMFGLIQLPWWAMMGVF